VQIDENEFHYQDFKNISAAVKNVTFDHKFNTFSSEFGSPNLIIVQELKKNLPLFRYELLLRDRGEINIKNGYDYFFFSEFRPDRRKPFAEGKAFDQRNFTDVKFVCNIYKHGEIENYFIMHNIYFHESHFEKTDELLTYLNHVYKNIEFDLPYGKLPDRTRIFQSTKDGALFINKRQYNLEIFFSNEVCEILGFDDKTLTRLKPPNFHQLLIDYFTELTDKEGKPLYSPHQLSIITKNVEIQALLNKQNDSVYWRLAHDNDRSVVMSANPIDTTRTTPQILGLRTNLSQPDIFKNCTYDTLAEFIKIKGQPNGVQIFEVKNPSFFKTSIEKLSKAKFQLIDIDTGKLPNFSIGTPTYIQLITSKDASMSHRFNIFLDSSDSVSKLYYPGNQFNDFIIKLPERLQFNSQWEIAMKNIFFGNDLFNIFRETCWIKITVIKTIGNADLSGNTQGVRADLHFENKHVTLADGRYNNIEKLCRYIQTRFEEENVSLRIDIRNHRVRIRCVEQVNTRAGEILREYSVTCSPFLSNILGVVGFMNEKTRINFDLKKSYLATYKPNIFLLIPTNFIIICDIVSETVFGSKSIKILKLLSTNFNPDNEIVHFTFHQNEFVDLDIKEFSSINIKIVDTTGNLIKSEGSYPTRCQLQFLKKKKNLI
jgi:hypothetical protein